MPEFDIDLDFLVRQVQSLAKYSRVSPELIRSLMVRELAKRPNTKEAVKSVRSKLHQVGTAYQEKLLPYADWTEELATLSADLHDPAALAFLQRILPAHSSTRERMPILPRFFTECLADLGEINSVLDIACGLNPLAIPWMPLKLGVTYTACDIFTDMVDFINTFFKHFQLNGRALLADVTQVIPTTQADLVLILKTIPCLEQMDKEAGRRLLTGLDAPNLLVSFPARSLRGRSKGMPRYYEQHFHELVAGRAWHITRFEFPGEIAFLVQK